MYYCMRCHKPLILRHNLTLSCECGQPLLHISLIYYSSGTTAIITPGYLAPQSVEPERVEVPKAFYDAFEESEA